MFCFSQLFILRKIRWSTIEAVFSGFEFTLKMQRAEVVFKPPSCAQTLNIPVRFHCLNLTDWSVLSMSFDTYIWTS